MDKRPLKVFLCHAHIIPLWDADRDPVHALYTRLTNHGVDMKIFVPLFVFQKRIKDNLTKYHAPTQTPSQSIPLPRPYHPLWDADRDAVRALYTRRTDDGVDAWLDKEKLLPRQDGELEIKKAVCEN